MRTYECRLIIGPRDVVSNPDIVTGQDGSPTHYSILPDGSRTAGHIPETISYDIYHNQSILCLQYDEKILVTGSSDSTCIVYDIKDNYRPLMRLYKHSAAVLDLAFDDRYIVTCSKDVTICVWDRATGAMLKQIRGHAGPVNAVQMRGNTIVSCSGDFKVKRWNIDSGKAIKELAGHTKGLACSQFSEDSKYIASAGNDKIIRIWDANTGVCLRNIAAHDNLVRSLHIDSISGRLVSGSYDQDIKVYDMNTGSMLLDFPKWHSSWVLGAKSDYRRIISTGQDPKILIMDFGMNIRGIEQLES
jgi:F-box and WD-40 domain protein 1/11